MNINNLNFQQQIVMNNASRKNYYKIAKWFNLASFIYSAITFVSVLIALIALKDKSEIGGYIAVIVVGGIKTIFSFIFWNYTKKMVEEVGTATEKSHLAFGVFTLIFANIISGIFILIATHSFTKTQALMTFNPSSSNIENPIKE